MRILLVYNRYQYRGGEDTHVDSLLKLLKDKGHQVGIYIKDSREINEKNFFEKLKIGLGMFWNLKVEKELSKLIRDFKPEIAHFHNIYPLIGPITYRVCKKFKVPIIQTIHNYKFMCPKNSLFRDGKICELCVKKRFFYPSVIYGCYHNSRSTSLVYGLTFLVHNLIKTYNLIDIFIFPSQFTRDYYVEALGLPKEKTIVVPYFLDIKKDQFKKHTEEKDYFLFLGRLSEEKGVKELLEIFKSLPKIKLLVIGDGPLKGETKKYQKYKNIIIKEFIDHGKIFSYILKAKAVIVPSLWYEVLPNVVLESFACGKLVLAPANRNFGNIINNNVTGLLYKNGDFGDLRKKIIMIATKKLIFKETKMRKEFNKEYTPQVHYSLLMEVYNSLLKKHERLN